MTNKKAVKILREKLLPCVFGEWKESVDAAISALQAQDLQPNLQPTCNCEDAVSRKELLKFFSNNGEGSRTYDTVAIGYIKALPSVTPKRKTGKWINNIYDLPVCDQCGYMTPYDRAIDDYEYGNFCPNCGAKMEGANNE